MSEILFEGENITASVATWIQGPLHGTFPYIIFHTLYNRSILDIKY